jgi:hypothetical protein
MDIDKKTTIADIIRPHFDFSDTINQHEIAKEYDERRNEKISPRMIRRIIEEMIEHGYPIISTPGSITGKGGYCWEGQAGEALECYKRLRQKAAKEFKRARHTLKNIYKGQLSLFEIKKRIKNGISKELD